MITAAPRSRSGASAAAIKAPASATSILPASIRLRMAERVASCGKSPGPASQTLRRSSAKSASSVASLTNWPGASARSIAASSRFSACSVTKPAPSRRAADAASRAAPGMLAPAKMVSWPRVYLCALTSSDGSAQSEG